MISSFWNGRMRSFQWNEKNKQKIRGRCFRIFLLTYTALDSFQGNSSIRTWLFSIAKNLYADYQKRSDRRVLPLDSIPEPAAPACHAGRRAG